MVRNTHQFSIDFQERNHRVLFLRYHNINISCNLFGKNIELIPQGIRWAKAIRLRFFVRISFRLLSEITSDKRSGRSSLDSHSLTFTSKQFESISSQKVDLKYLKKLLANKELPFLFKCNFFMPKCSSMMLLFWVKSIFFWLQ